MPKYKLTLAYDGSPFGGWQIQPNAVSIQSLVQAALSTILRQKVPIVGAGRTDAGVHAKGQVAHFTAIESISENKVLRSLNGLLPPEIRALSLERVPDSFHARYSASGKIYYYHLRMDPIVDPFNRLYSYHVPHKVDIQLMGQASLLCLGTHDFSSFANEAHSGAAAKNPIRTLTRLDIVPEKGGVRLEFEGDGFLYKMVRNLVGTLLDVGSGRISPISIETLLQSKDRRLAGRAAPAHGLFLVQVHYPETFSIEIGDTQQLFE